MNACVEHHQQAIGFDYSCFDRILLNAVIQVLQNPAAVAGFLKEKRQAPQLSPAYLRTISTDYHHFVERLAEQRQIEIVPPPKDVRREAWVEPFYQSLHGQNGLAVILKSRENARVAVSFPRQGNHIELCNRFVWQYYFYLQDQDFGRMFLRIWPYFPFNARVCLNGHEWLACCGKRTSASSSVAMPSAFVPTRHGWMSWPPSREGLFYGSRSFGAPTLVI